MSRWKLQGWFFALTCSVFTWSSACVDEADSQTGAQLTKQPIRLPQDEGPHEVPLEWWYYTGHLQANSGDAWGFQVTFFKLRSGADLFLGNFAVTDHQRGEFFFGEKAWVDAAEQDRYAIDLAGWRASGADGYDNVAVRAGDYAVELDFSPLKAAVLHGQDGVTGSGPEAAHYYSRTRMHAAGTLTSHDEVQAVTGVAWMDHEWFELPVEIDHLSWDWFAIQLDDDVEIMLGVSRVDGRRYAEGTWVDANGESTRLSGDDFSVHARDQWQSPNTGRTYPMRWTVALPSRNVELYLEPVLRDQELHGMKYTPLDYWEGEVEITGHSLGNTVHGQGYVELTGYQ